MAEEAFALSPMSARASLPSEADYDAIREAFMETARGRWFLSEYTKRNRNADTNMVLEAVTRMEANLAAQKQASSVVSLIETLGLIRAAIRDAKVTAAEAMPRFDDDETLAAAHKGARIIREIAWTLRECGADVRICDMLDTQVQAIEAGQQRTATGDGRAAVLASFDVLVQRIEQLATADVPHAAGTASATEAPATAPAEKAASSVTPLFRHAAEAVADIADAPAAMAEAPAEIADAAMQAPTEAIAHGEIADLADESTAASVETAAVEAALVEQAREIITPHLPEPELEAQESIAPIEVEANPSDAETAADLAVLDIVAMEMAAVDLSEPEAAVTEMLAPEPELPEPMLEAYGPVAPIDVEANPSDAETAADLAVPDMAAMEVGAPDLSEPEAAVAEMHAPEPVEQPVIEAAPMAVAAQAVAAPEPTPERSYHPSLGAALIANGVVAHPTAPTSDPLAPIRRMSQAEKIAFFS